MSEKVTKYNFANSSPVYIEEFKDTKPANQRTDNIMTKRKRKTLHYKTIHRQIKIEQHEPH
jgi:hypothetical protein